MSHRDTAKTWFETGDKPTQAQFAQLFDWLLFSGEVTMADIIGLVDALQSKLDTRVFERFEQGDSARYNGDGSYIIPGSRLLEKMIVLAGADATISLGDTDNGGEIDPGQDVLAGVPFCFTLNLYAKGNRVIFLNGVPGDTKIVFLNRFIPL